MSFRINNNISALAAYNDVSNVTEQMNMSMSKLSRGLRIRDAGDDPAGLISSELFRSHITSMEAAIRNNQEALNYAKTAENALGEMNKLLAEGRALSIASGNKATLSSSQLSANQDQMASIIASINRISGSTAYGSRRLLDGSAGVTTQISNAAKVAGFSFSGLANSTSITVSGLMTINQTVAATRASYVSTVTLATGARQSGTVAINGVSFDFAQGSSGVSMASTINAATAQTGVTANYDATTNFLTLTQTKTGVNREIAFTDSTGVMSTAANTQGFAAGTNATATVTMGGQNVLFTGGRNGNDGLTLTDGNGNGMTITDGGNLTGTSLMGRVIAGSSQFQIGYLTTAVANLSLRNMASGQLGTGVVAGSNLSSIDLTAATGPTDALTILDKAIDEVSQMRGQIGNFQRNVLETNNRSLTSMRENLQNSESTIRDLDVAEEMTKYTKWQVMQQAGMSMLGQANQSGQSVLSLLRG